MSATTTEIFRYPIKSHGREPLSQTQLIPGRGLPWDRAWAVAHDAAKVDGGAWVSCHNFSRVAKAPELAAISASLDEDTGEVTLQHPKRETLRFFPDREGDQLIGWTKPLMPENRAASTRVIRAAKQGFTDNPAPFVTLANHASHRAVAQRIGSDISIHRWRANIWCDGLAPWEEFDWIDREIRVGSAVVIPRERTERCLATHANPETGARDVNILDALDSWQHRDFSILAEVVQGGTLRLGDEIGPA